jgi:hypothetical protein
MVSSQRRIVSSGSGHETFALQRSTISVGSFPAARRGYHCRAQPLRISLPSQVLNLDAFQLTQPVHVQLLWAVARYPHISGTRMAGVGNGNSDVGLTGLRLDRKVPLQRESGRKCGAMSEQSADSGRGNQQVPQKQVHLVGTRDPSPQLPWVRPRPA